MSENDLLHNLPDSDELPFDEDGFIISFEMHELAAIAAFREQWGFVCVRNVLSAAECETFEREFFKNFNADDAESIEAFYSLPRNEFAQRMALIGLSSDIDTVSLLRNRQHPRVHAAYAAVMQCEQLLVDQGRMGAMRPTIKHSEWKTLESWLHLDCNPLTGRVSIASYGESHLPHDFDSQWLPQGFLSITDARAQDGGFVCVPGGHKIAREWAQRYHADSSGRMLHVDDDDPLNGHQRQIPVRRGCLFVWDAFLFHANHPNNSDRWRIVQYMRMYPSNKTPFTPLWPRKEIPDNDQFQLTPLGEKLFGYEPWEAADASINNDWNCTIQ